MYKAFEVSCRGPYAATDTRPDKVVVIACTEHEARKKFRKMRPNHDIIKIEIRK